MQELPPSVLPAFYRVLRLLEHLEEERTPHATRLRDELVSAISDVEHYTREQDAAEREARRLAPLIRAQCRTLRSTHMTPLARAAKRMLGGDGGAPAGFARPGTRASPEMVVAAARGFAEHAEAYETQLVAQGLARNFIAELRRAALDLHVSLDAARRATDRRADAARCITRAVEEGRAVVGRAESVVVAALQDDQARLAEWRSAMRWLDAPRPHAPSIMRADAGLPAAPSPGR